VVISSSSVACPYVAVSTRERQSERSCARCQAECRREWLDVGRTLRREFVLIADEILAFSGMKKAPGSLHVQHDGGTGPYWVRSGDMVKQVETSCLITFETGVIRTARPTTRTACWNKNLAIANRSRVSCINTNNNIMTLKSGFEVTQGH